MGVFALPGSDGDAAPVLLGGSNIAVSAKSQNQELAAEVVKLMLSDEYQSMFAAAGLTPAKTSLASKLGTDEFAQATITAASNAKLTPAAANWAAVEGSRGLRICLSASRTAATSSSSPRTPTRRSPNSSIDHRVLPGGPPWPRRPHR